MASENIARRIAARQLAADPRRVERIEQVRFHLDQISEAVNECRAALVDYEREQHPNAAARHAEGVGKFAHLIEARARGLAAPAKNLVA